MNTLCDAFTKAALDTWQRISEGYDLNYPFGEETLTDLLLRDLLRLRLPDFTIRAYTKPEESREGADWEWWFGGSSGYWVGLRIQAKVIDRHAQFDHLHYPLPGTSKPVGIPDHEFYQCDKLIDRAQNATPARIPVYCLYSFWSAPGYVPAVGPCCWGSWSPASSFGCSILGARQVQKLRHTGQAAKPVRYPRHLRHTFPHSLPLACLVCFPFEVCIAEHLAAVLRRAQVVDTTDPYLHLVPPPYVTELLNRSSITALEPDNRQEGLPDVPAEVARVTVVRQARAEGKQ